MTHSNNPASQRATQTGRMLRVFSPTQWVGVAGLVLGAAVVGVITLTPTPVDRGKRHIVAAVLDALHGLGVPASFGYAQLEFSANVVMFLPLGLCIGLLVRGGRWWLLALAIPPLISACIETAQFLFLPERTADLSDVLANTLGGWIGLAIAAAWHWVRGASRSHSSN